MTGDVAATLRALKEQSGGTIMKYGLTQLDRTLLANKLVDEYNLWIVPTVVRQGKRAFEDVATSLPKLDLVDVRRFTSGSAILRYSPRY
jgi:dihydrofolate reductase